MTVATTLSGALSPTDDCEWIIEEAEYDPLREGSRGSRFAISNGFLGVRGARAIHRGGRWVGASRTLVAGLFDTADEEHAIPGLIAAPNWLHVRILRDGVPLTHREGDGTSQHRILDLRRGLLLTDARLSNADVVWVRLRSLHLASLSHRAIGLQLIQMELERGEAEITLNASLEVSDTSLLPERVEQGLGVWNTTSSGKRLAMATALTLLIDGVDIDPTSSSPLQWSWRWTSHPGQVVCLARTVAVTCGVAGEVHPGQDAVGALDVARKLGWSDVVAAHETAWTKRWHCSDVEIEGDAAAQRALRFALYHLNGAANPDDEHVSIAARALTGDDYRGHVFWDTEIYLLPFFTLTWPLAARALLMYRFHTLDGARAKAAELGWRGALYAWESADTGAETCPLHVIGPDRKLVEVKCGRQEQHISADIAYAVWQYWQATGDDGFMRDAGAEILMETARFWSSRARPEPDGHCHVRGVIGPDEYHESIDDNSFTNVMARCNIRRALDVVEWLRARWPEQWGSLAVRLALSDAELEQWRTIAETIMTGFNPKTGLFEQFAGFFSLDDVDLSRYAGRSVPIDVVLGPEQTRQSQIVKQADVVALLALLPDEFPGDTGAKNFGYYAPRCAHGSSLSLAMHGVVAARLGETEAALDYFRRTSAIDLEDNHAAIDGGVHIAALGGIWSMVVFGFAGLALHADHLTLNPRIPAAWQSLRFGLQWRGRYLKIKIEHATASLEVTLDVGEPMTLVVNGKAFALSREQPLWVLTNFSSR
ncbi:glycoside hydrolase family 65 protein [Caballeronia sp. M23-90]